MELITAGILSQETQLTTTEGGTNKVVKVFDLSKLDQSVLYILKNHDDAIKCLNEKAEENTERIQQAEENMKHFQDKVENQIGELATLIKTCIANQEKEKLIKDNTINTTTYNF